MTFSAKPCHRAHGFTLLELAVVLVIISLVTAMTMASGAGIIAGARRDATLQKMAAIDQALLAFRIGNDRLPCPADLTQPQSSGSFGIEASNPGACSGGAYVANFISGVVKNNVRATETAEGGIPTVSLGLPADFAYDGWGNRIRYAADIAMTQTEAFLAYPAGSACGPISVNDSLGNSRTSTAIYALISHGPNGYGAFVKSGAISENVPTNSNEQTNCHYNGSACAQGTGNTGMTLTYVQQSVAKNTTDVGFDDIVTFKERWQMQVPWDRPGNLCPMMIFSDYYNNRVQFFSVGLNSLNATWLSNLPYSTTAYSSVNGQFAHPVDTVLDANNNLWVSDQDNNRIQEFSYNPANVNSATTSPWTWLRTIGGGPGSTCGTSPSPSVPACPGGTGNGQFENDSTQLTMDLNGNLLTTGQYYLHIQKFGPTGNFIQTINVTNGDGPAQFAIAMWGTNNGVPGDNCDVTAIAPCIKYIVVDAENNYWIGAWNYWDMHVEEFNSNGVYIGRLPAVSPYRVGMVMNGTTYYMGGGMAGFLIDPETGHFFFTQWAINSYGCGPAGNLGCDDSLRNFEFDSSGNLLRTFGQDGVNSWYPSSGIVYDPWHRLWLATVIPGPTNDVRIWTFDGTNWNAGSNVIPTGSAPSQDSYIINFHFSGIYPAGTNGR